VKTLIDTATLKNRLGEDDLVVLDARFRLTEPSAGRTLWAAGHVPGARYAHLDADLSAPVTGTTGRHPLPDPDALAGRLSAWGVGPGTSVVVYDDAGGAIAARAWWLLRWLGHDDVAVLDGGIAAWEAAGGPVDSRDPVPIPRAFAGRPRAGLVAAVGEVEAGVGAGSMVLVDVREASRFEGRAEPIDPVAGHVPGAVSLPWQANLGADGRFLPPEALAARYQPLLAAGEDMPVFMCGSGVTACHGLLAMAHAGLGEGRLYAGSWSEWIRDPSRPVA
jgi:thiosulfate/3-mercaptopyruvate sulfurtransferase